MKILLGLTGSVASILYKKLIEDLQKVGEVEVILTDRAKHFVSNDFLKGVKVWTDKDEWQWKDDEATKHSFTTSYKTKWEKNDRVLHIELRDNASALVIAPCSANTLAKLANGICDNLLTSVARAWDMNRPIIIAPAMNTHMWNHPVTRQHIATIKSFSKNVHIVQPQSKMLACNTEGMGALAEISNITEILETALQWHFPLHDAWDTEPKCSGIPQAGHPGAFLTTRKHHTHTGVDLYTTDGQSINAVEDGTIVAIEDFTGVSQQSPWWEDTKCILIEGASGVVCYGEMEPAMGMSVGRKVSRGDFIGCVKRVIKLGKERPDIDGHSTSMLHVEIYKHGTYRSFEENPKLGPLSDWSVLIDPTPFLMNSTNRPKRLLK